MRYFIFALIFVFSAPVFAKDNVPPPVELEVLPPDTETRPVELSKVVVDLNRGQPFGRVKAGWVCIGAETLVWRTGRSQVNPEDFNEVFKAELEKVGFQAIGQSSNLFEDGRDTKAEYLIGGRIKSIFVDACLPDAGFGNIYKAKGKALLEVEWQIYNRLDRKVVATHTTRTGYKRKKSAPGGVESLLYAAFAENVRALVASKTLHKFLIGKPVDLNVARKPNENLEPLSMQFGSDKGSSLETAIAGTVLVLSGSGHGSGFLVSSDGYFLTNEHVVGQATYVKLRWSDGEETLGEVIRTDKGRDIALVKANTRDRKPIPVSKSQSQIGQTVRAIGAPLDEKLQNTVTSGIVSADRVLDGYRYLQSDVSVVPGNSGGPLVSESGDALAVTVAGIRINNAPQGVNFFIPITEALAFLGVSETKAPAKDGVQSH